MALDTLQETSAANQDDDPVMCHRIAEAALERQRRLGAWACDGPVMACGSMGRMGPQIGASLPWAHYPAMICWGIGIGGR